MFGKTMANTHDIGSNFLFIGKPNTSDFSESRVWLSWRHGSNNSTDSPLKWGWYSFHEPVFGIEKLGQTSRPGFSNLFFATFF
jgi:hypothetical protein